MSDRTVEAASEMEAVLLEFDLAELRAATVEAALRDELEAVRTELDTLRGELDTVRSERDDALARHLLPISAVSPTPMTAGQAAVGLGRVVSRLRPAPGTKRARLLTATRRFRRSGSEPVS